MRLTLRFFILIGALLAAVAASAMSGHRALNSLDAALARVVDSDMQRLLAITHARRVFRSMTVLERDYILARSPSEREGSREKMHKLGEELVQHLDRYAALMPASDAPRLAEIRRVRERWLERDGAVLTAAETDQDQALTLAKLHKKDPVSWETEIGELVKLSESRLADQVASTHAEARQARVTLAAVSALATLVAAGLGSFIFLAIRRNVAAVVQLNTTLEGRVAERTRELDERQRSLQLVLDSTGEGFIMVDLAGAILGPCSQAAVRWFGEPGAGMGIAEYLQPEDLQARLELDCAISQLGEDIMPWDVSLEQTPKRLRRAEQTLELDLRQVFEGDRFARMLVIVRNVTERLRGEDAERGAREQQAVITKLLSDKLGFAQFVADTEHLFEGLADADDATLRLRLHTLKGNVGLFGMQSLAEHCHALEDKLAEEDGRLRADEIHGLLAAWRHGLLGIDGFLHAAKEGVFEVKPDEHAELMRNIAARRDYAELLALVEIWTWTPALDVLGRVRAQMEFLVKKLSKSAQVVVSDNGVRIPPRYLEKFWPTLVHVSRNMVDHGIEPENVRVSLGKSAQACLRLTMAQTEHELLLEISDDGPGIDREALTKRASELGLAPAGDEPVEMLIFENGLSTREFVTEFSGRGVGLSATRDACRAEGGHVDVVSVAGRGTTLRFRFPRPIAKPGGEHPESGKRWTLRPARVA